MVLKINSYILKKNSPTILICMVGTSAVAYGMFKGNNLIFIIGMLFVIGGYVHIRRKIKKSIRHNP
jgi:hypothetical protein